jgi:hypothetical protein
MSPPVSTTSKPLSDDFSSYLEGVLGFFFRRHDRSHLILAEERHLHFSGTAQILVVVSWLRATVYHGQQMPESRHDKSAKKKEMKCRPPHGLCFSG